jgi:hypothetical protein
MLKENDDIEFKKFAAVTMIDLSKLLTTLSSSFLALTATFSSSFYKTSNQTSVSVDQSYLLFISWALIVLSTISGVLGIGSIVTTAQESEKYDIDSGGTNCYLGFQQLLFVTSFVVFTMFAVSNV